MNNNIFIGLSWPYANSDLHIGHLGSSLPADILARYYRLKGDKVCFVSGSDCFGTPISIKAQKEGKTAEEIANYYHLKFKNTFERLNFSFDNYIKTTDKNHIEFAKDFHKDLYNGKYVYTKDEQRLFCVSCNRFLPDRYVEGNCPNCGANSRGDACEKCGKILEPEDLKNPHCGLCGSKPIYKNSFQYYLKLSSLEKDLNLYFNNKSDCWSQNAINLTNRYFDEGLIDRAISRDLDWGVPVPDNKITGKVIYNWGENVLGYISACKDYCVRKNKNFNNWFKNDNSKHIYVHAKDNVQFHSIIYPALLLANKNKYHLPDFICSYEFVTLNGQKISKSRGNCITIDELLDNYDLDFLRYYFAKNISDKKDLDFTKTDFVNTINGELINNWGNFVNRTLSFVKNKFNATIQKRDLDLLIKEKIELTFCAVSKFIESGKVSSAVKEIFQLVDFSNKYFNNSEPWNIYKQDKLKCESLCYSYLTLIYNISILLNPIIPNGTEKVLNWLGLKINKYNFSELKGVKIKDFYPLYVRI